MPLSCQPRYGRDVAKKKKLNRVAAPRTTVPLSVLFRVFVLGSVSVVAAGYGIYRYYFERNTVPMLVPAPSATEIPAPDLEK